MFKDKYYVENQFLWPLIIDAWGEDSFTHRIAPFYSHSLHKGVEKRWFLWPFLRIKTWHDEDIEVIQEQAFYFLFWKQRQRSISNPDLPEVKKMHLWPLYSYWNNGAGQKQLQMLSPFEVLFPSNRAVRRAYSPLFAIFKAEQLAPGHTKQSILFDFISAEKSPEYQKFALGPIFKVERQEDSSKIEFLTGLIGFKKECGKKSFKFFWTWF